jgi:hypothetical protein
VIGAAIHGGGSSGSKGSNDAPVTPQEQAARDRDSADLAALTGDSGGKQKSPDISVGGQHVKPGSNGLFDLSSSSNDLPVPLLVSLIAVGLLIVGTGLVVLRERVPALARIPLLSKIPTPRGSFSRFRR